MGFQFIQISMPLNRQSGHGIHVGTVFVDCILYADDIVLLSVTVMVYKKW